MKRTFIFLLFGLAMGLQAFSSKGEYAIIGVDVISMRSDEIDRNQTVIIKDGRIELVANADEANVSENAFQIDGVGKFLIPGLAELHAHIPIPIEGDVAPAHEAMMLFVAHGITTIRGMKGDVYHLNLRDQIAAGDVVGPRIFTCGARLNSGTVKTVEGAKKIVEEQFDAGFDFIKIHRNLSPELFHAIADAADALDMGIAGHVPETVGIREALSRNYLTIDHFDGYMEGLAPDSMEIIPFKYGGLFAVPLATKADVSKMEALVQLTKSKNTWMVPTAAWLERLVTPADPQVYLSEPGMAYVSKKMREGWARSKANRNRSIDPQTAKKYVEIRRALLKNMHDAGVGMLFGCDAPQFANVPGFSMHHEIESYQATGLSNMDILKMATINPAIFFKKTNVFGTIQEGLDADLALLDGNPLEDMENLRDPVGVMLRGKWLSREYLETELAKIAEKYR